ncbi:bifunctional folylpolyglutamate synthase/dihydrofolate synthase, partial [Paenibacillus polymyxa]|uniref:bifunctional folylpolyglutamate synthase/dihydrofolate synthase n=1 Tax=Paenibacillus polymyxa TaxID=1406 RepID=UPI000A8F2213
PSRGLGGTFDSTNIVKPLLSVITSIGHDHMAILGNTIEEIAGQKAGIIKNSIPVITGVNQPEALGVIEAEAEKKQAPYQSLYKTCRLFNEAALPSGESFSLETETRCYENIQTSLIGIHQRQNAALAILAAEWLNRLEAAAISEEAMRNGLKKASWPGRFERLQSRPLVFADGAHNEEGVETLIETIRQRFAGKNVHVVFSALKDKPYQ